MRELALPQPDNADWLLEGITDPGELHTAQLILAQCVQVDPVEYAARQRAAYIKSLNIMPVDPYTLSQQQS